MENCNRFIGNIKFDLSNISTVTLNGNSDDTLNFVDISTISEINENINIYGSSSYNAIPINTDNLTIYNLSNIFYLSTVGQNKNIFLKNIKIHKLYDSIDFPEISTLNISENTKINSLYLLTVDNLISNDSNIYYADIGKINNELNFNNVISESAIIIKESIGNITITDSNIYKLIITSNNAIDVNISNSTFNEIVVLGEEIILTLTNVERKRIEIDVNDLIENV